MGEQSAMVVTETGELTGFKHSALRAHGLADDLFGSGLVVVSFDNGSELAKQFTDAWFERAMCS
jgi:hypothetical protein